MVIIHLTNEKESIPLNLMCLFQSLLVMSFSALHKNRIMTFLFSLVEKRKNLEVVYK